MGYIIPELNAFHPQLLQLHSLFRTPSTPVSSIFTDLALEKLSGIDFGENFPPEEYIYDEIPGPLNTSGPTSRVIEPVRGIIS